MAKGLVERYREHAARSGERMTPQKLAILEFLDGNPNHPTVQEIFAFVKARLGQTARVTVYRFLRELIRNGMVRALCVDPDRMRFDADTTPHHHAVCRVCGRIVDIPADVITCHAGKVPEDFALTGHMEVVLWGICNLCAGKQK